METPKVLIAQALADEWALIAQKYAGFFFGHPISASQHGKGAPKVDLDTTRAWVEPFARADDCEFCKITSDDRVRARVAGFQQAITIEVDRANMMAGSGFGYAYVAAVTTEAVDLTQLPFYLQKRLCIEWNHAFKRWLDGQEALEYDFEEHCLRIKGATDQFVGDPEELAALQADLEADHGFAAAPAVDDGLSLHDQIAIEYENGF